MRRRTTPRLPSVCLAPFSRVGRRGTVVRELIVGPSGAHPIFDRPTYAWEREDADALFEMLIATISDTSEINQLYECLFVSRQQPVV